MSVQLMQASVGGLGLGLQSGWGSMHGDALDPCL